MLRFAFGALLLVGSAPLAAQTVEVASGDWDHIPAVSAAGKFSIGEQRMSKIEHIVAAGDCPAAGNKRLIDIDVPFMLEYTPDGALKRVVIQRIGCPELETELGGAVLDLATMGEYSPTGVNANGWYRGKIAFATKL